MNRTSLMAAILGIGIISAGVASADCAADLAALEGGNGADGISKDGSLAPLQQADGSSVTDGISKDGTTAPLEDAGGDSGQAMSGQDVQAQQDGQPTAAGQAQAESGPDARAAALKDARTALDAGDEAACMEAVAKAKAS
ncbi:hypothetical protein SAMN06265221_11461 [Paracoccus laeviglucosivorans]|uniref:Uncharacterized protein n=2 Tax=Paracoccus laeviglucosivorans TaxID=1197861 RepID=A0A521ENT9_9RHOB|nr:hypothetical protein SAMN06265221_11461 [Paracoccus laeviglucosivorans]